MFPLETVDITCSLRLLSLPQNSTEKMIQLTHDNSNIHGKSNKFGVIGSSSYRKMEINEGN